jgi:uncharacterized iron-regulated membrane protein
MAFSPDSPLLTVTTGPTPDAAGEDMSLLFLDRASGASLGPAPGNPLMDFLLQLHTDMFLGLPGMWVLGAMGLLFVVALISGTVLYAPFMRRIAFGTVRTERSPRVKRLDQHNLIGIVALAWMAVIGLTGAINAFADPLTDSWRDGEVAAMAAAYEGAMARSTRRWPRRKPPFPVAARNSSAFPVATGRAGIIMRSSFRAIAR